MQVAFELQGGAPFYEAGYQGETVIAVSRLGFRFKDQPSLESDLRMVNTARSSFDETWTLPWGEVEQIRNHYNELRVTLEENAGQKRRFIIVFRVYDDGFGFRYEFPSQKNLGAFLITDELTQFVPAGDYAAWWIPAYRPNRYEFLYTRLPVSSLDTVHTPLTLESETGVFLSIHEANLTDYASMTLIHNAGNVLECDLVPWSDGVKVRAVAPAVTPWRTIQMADSPGGLITSYLILNLNEPSRLEDASWITPGKYVGIWWAMHIGRYTWGSGGRHGATTANARRYIDFAAEHGFEGVLVEGWNTGWDGDWTANGDLFSYTTPHPDFDIAEVAAYAASRGVQLIGHHETGAGIDNYERQLEEAFALYRSLGIRTVKTGYVGWGQGIERTDENGELQKEWHHGQYMVRHYRKVVETTARYGIMLNVHEPIMATGIRRTWPNMMTREGARGQEYNAWSGDGGNPPEHTTILPFTRLLAGPFDFTPGIFDLFFEKAGRPDNRVNTTLAKQLALYVVIYSPLQMAADLPENYGQHPAFKFIEDVPADWRETRVLHGRIGDFVTIVRRDRNSADWYLGSVTDEQGRTLQAELDFLEPGKTYAAEIYADAVDADWVTNPLATDIRSVLVDRNTTLTLDLAPGGGQAVRFRPAEEAEQRELPWYR